MPTQTDPSTTTRSTRFGRLVGSSAPMRRLFSMIGKSARGEFPVLITGETGTGKDLIAQEIHARSARAREPFVAINTGLLPSDLLASELFGHRMGAFTGATQDKLGRFAEADGGTLFLDEIGTMEERTQIALLRVLDTGAFRPVGAKRDVRVDVRLIAATNEQLESAVQRGDFREDLFHRFQVFRINTPPLRSLNGDIRVLAHHFLHTFNDENDFTVEGFEHDVLEVFNRYAWPGNMRELKNVVAQSAVMAGHGTIALEHTPPRLRTPGHVEADAPYDVIAMSTEPRTPSGATSKTQDGLFIPIGVALEEVERTYVLKTLAHCHHNKSKAAKMLGISRKTLYDRLKRWGVM